MFNIGLVIHAFMLTISFLIILIILFLITKHWNEFLKLHYYKTIVFLSSIAICISAHEIVYYNFINTYKLKPIF